MYRISNKKRFSDYEKPKQGKSLFKPGDSYVRSYFASVYEGGNDDPQLGPHVKTTSHGTRKVFLSPRNEFVEYYAFEILNELGFRAPKARFTTKKHWQVIASEALIGYIPISAFLGEASIPERFFNPIYEDLLSGRQTFSQTKKTIRSLEENFEAHTTYKRTQRALIDYEKYGQNDLQSKIFIRYAKSGPKLQLGANLNKEDPAYIALQRYQFIPQMQMIFDNVNNKYLPIRGHAFAAHLAAYLLQDSDSQFDGENSGLILSEYGFEFALIDKEYCMLSLQEENPRFEENFISGLERFDLLALFKFTTKDQRLAVLASIAELIKSSSNQSSTLENIFFNARTATMLSHLIPRGFINNFYEVCNGILWGNSSILYSLKETLALRVNSFQKAHTELLDHRAAVEKYRMALWRIYNDLLQDDDFSSMMTDKQLIEIDKKMRSEEWKWSPLVQMDSILKTAALLLNHYLKTPEELTDFYQREKIRRELAEKVILNLLDPNDKTVIRMAIENIVEDLRGVRFQTAFTDQQQFLITAEDLNNFRLSAAVNQAVIEEYLVTNKPAFSLK